MHPPSLLFYEALGMLVVSLVILTVTGFKIEMQPKGILFGVLTGISGSLAMAFYLWALTKEKTPAVVIITALYPLVTLLLVFLILREPVTLKQGMGIVFALLAMALMAS